MEKETRCRLPCSPGSFFDEDMLKFRISALRFRIDAAAGERRRHPYPLPGLR